MIEKLFTMLAWFVGVTAVATIVVWLLIKLASVGVKCRFAAAIIAFIIFANIAMYAAS